LGDAVIEFGSGPPLVLIPGVQGRWEYLRPAIDALARTFRVLTFPLCGERGGEQPFDPGLGFDNDARQVLALLDRRGIERAAICGISFGGLPAIRFAATHPERVSALVLTSTPAPPWQLRPRHRVYSTLPWLFGPLFFVESPFRLRKEIAAALPQPGARWRFAQAQLATLARAPLSPTRMAARAALIATTDVGADCAVVTAPTLVVTGERALDRVVSVDRTLAYLDLIPGARHATLENTGHLGSITKPHEFAALVRAFVIGPPDEPPPGRRRSADASEKAESRHHARSDMASGLSRTADEGRTHKDPADGRRRATA
jgi:3-oxoadipate enol-lactonase